TDGRARRAGLLHGLLNIGATALVATSYALRRGGSRAAGRGTALAGYGIAAASAYLGGDLVYRERIGVTHAAVAEPERFTPVLASAELADNSMQKAVLDDASVVVARQHGRVCALAHACAHLGGPLSEGALNDGSVVCPWHGSEFALEDGRVLNGPATHPQPCFTVRERGGQIELRARPTEAPEG
ncbi:MAG: Rieske 2Fe-2S domain-containing protein, partial [Vicinamibacterales bacterium]